MSIEAGKCARTSPISPDNTLYICEGECFSFFLLWSKRAVNSTQYISISSLYSECWPEDTQLVEENQFDLARKKWGAGQ